MNKFARLLERDGPIVIDGGLATELEATGHDIGGALWSAKLLVGDPHAIVAAHRAYLDAGAEIIITASYQASRVGFATLGYDAAEADRLIASSVALAREARDAYLADAGAGTFEPLVAASVGPWAVAQHDGSEYTGAYDATDEDLRNFHAARLEVLDTAGADLLAVETIPNAREAAILGELLKDVRTPAWLSFACCDGSRLNDGTRLRNVAEPFAGHPRVLAVGINCTPPRFVLPLLEQLGEALPGLPLVAYPNSGETFDGVTKTWSGAACDLDRDFRVVDWYRAGARLIGGCCRTGPADISAIAGRLETINGRAEAS